MTYFLKHQVCLIAILMVFGVGQAQEIPTIKRRLPTPGGLQMPAEHRAQIDRELDLYVDRLWKSQIKNIQEMSKHWSKRWNWPSCMMNSITKSTSPLLTNTSKLPNHGTSRLKKIRPIPGRMIQA